MWPPSVRKDESPAAGSVARRRYEMYQGRVTEQVTPDGIGSPFVLAALITSQVNSPAVGAAALSQVSKWILNSCPASGSPNDSLTTLRSAWSKSFGVPVAPTPYPSRLSETDWPPP